MGNDAIYSGRGYADPAIFNYALILEIQKLNKNLEGIHTELNNIRMNTDGMANSLNCIREALNDITMRIGDTMTN